jgi:antitoxin component YwqK of YwqJK toxin-antitoxin module
MDLQLKKMLLLQTISYQYMKGYIFVTVIWLMGIICIAQQSDSMQYVMFYYPDSVISSEGWMKDGQPNGYWKSYYSDGTIRTEGNRKDFLLDSIWKFYTKQGQIQSEITYRSGIRHGISRVYSKEGIEEYNYIYDTIQGMAYLYSCSGHVLKRTPYENGKENGLAKLYDTLGKITGTIEYVNGYIVKREYVNRVNQNGMKQGCWKFFWENGNLMLEGYYQNDKKNGFFKYYDEGGNFLKIEKWENDILLEDAVETKRLERKVDYHTNGRIKTVAYFYKGIPDGIRREYSPQGDVVKSYMFRNGVLMGEGIVDDNGKKQGEWKEFYETGKLRAKGKYANSKPVGKWIYYFESGNIEITGTYSRKGEKDGEWIWYYPDRNILSIENYADGLAEGEFFSLSHEGDTLEHGFYLDGMEDGRWMYVNDNVLVEGVYVSGKRDGVWKTCYPNGKVKRMESYYNDELDGRSSYYWENSVKKAEYTYVNGLLNGNAYQYDTEGNLLFTTTYRMGIEIRYEGVKVTPEIDISFE